MERRPVPGAVAGIVQAGPMSYAIDGRQHVAIAAGNPTLRLRAPPLTRASGSSRPPVP
jgi:hypothetical protein